MSTYRRNEVYVDNETRFYLELRRKQLIGDTDAAMTVEQVLGNDLRAKYTTENPDWVLAWEKRETMRQKHKKDLATLENEAVGLSAELQVERRE